MTHPVKKAGKHLFYLLLILVCFIAAAPSQTSTTTSRPTTARRGSTRQGISQMYICIYLEKFPHINHILVRPVHRHHRLRLHDLHRFRLLLVRNTYCTR